MRCAPHARSPRVLPDRGGELRHARRKRLRLASRAYASTSLPSRLQPASIASPPTRSREAATPTRGRVRTRQRCVDAMTWAAQIPRQIRAITSAGIPARNCGKPRRIADSAPCRAARIRRRRCRKGLRRRRRSRPTTHCRAPSPLPPIGITRRSRCRVPCIAPWPSRRTREDMPTGIGCKQARKHCMHRCRTGIVQRSRQHL